MGFAFHARPERAPARFALSPARTPASAIGGPAYGMREIRRLAQPDLQSPKSVRRRVRTETLCSVPRSLPDKRLPAALRRTGAGRGRLHGPARRRRCGPTRRRLWRRNGSARSRSARCERVEAEQVEAEQVEGRRARQRRAQAARRPGPHAHPNPPQRTRNALTSKNHIPIQPERPGTSPAGTSPNVTAVNRGSSRRRPAGRAGASNPTRRRPLPCRWGEIRLLLLRPAVGARVRHQPQVVF